MKVISYLTSGLFSMLLLFANSFKRHSLEMPIIDVKHSSLTKLLHTLTFVFDQNYIVLHISCQHYNPVHTLKQFG